MKSTLPCKILIVISLFTCMVSTNAFSQTTYFWVGNSGDWKDLSHWSLTSGGAPVSVIPTINDDVIFDANSFTAPGQVVTITDDGTDIGVSFHTMNWQGVTNMPTFRIHTVTSNWIANEVGGSLYFDDNMIIDFHMAEFYFASSTNYDLDTKGHNLGLNCFLSVNLSYDGTAGSAVTCNLLSDLNHVLLYLDKGIFASNGFEVNGQAIDGAGANYMWIRNSSVANFSNSVITSGHLNITESASVVDDNGHITISQQLSAIGQDFNHVAIIDTVIMSGAATGGNTFQTLELLPSSIFSLKEGSTQTVINLIANGIQEDPITIKSAVDGTTAYLSKSSGVVELHYAHIKDISATGGATFKAYNSWNDGNVVGIQFMVHDSDSMALVDLYNSTNGPAWVNNTGWLTDNVENWFGVTIVDGRVAGLNLGSNNLVGSIPPEIGSLTNLETLLLYSNQLSGPIPPEIGALTNLTVLNLNNNELSGFIPLTIGSLTNLSAVAISHNQLSGSIPPEIAASANLADLDLSNNQLSGSVPAEIGSLSNLQYLRLQNNQFADLPDLSAFSNMVQMNVSNNLFTFEDLEPNIAISGITYAPQDSIDVEEDLFTQVSATQVFSASIGGSANAYQWKKNGNVIDGATNISLSLPNITFDDDAVYTYDAISSFVPGLTLHSRKKILRVSSIERDSIALMVLFNATGGPDWVDKSNWGTTPLRANDWYGVTIGNDRVTAVNLPVNNLQGAVPQVFADIENLQSVNLSGNKIERLADLSTLTQLLSFDVSSNKLDFASLLPNVGLTGFIYSTQADVGEPITDSLAVHSPYELSISTEGEGNVYQWKHNDQAISLANAPDYLIEGIDRSSMGTYVCEIENPSVPGLILKSAPANLYAVAELSGRLYVSTDELAQHGKVTLFRITDSAYDTIQTVPLAPDGRFTLNEIVLDDYQLMGFADTLTHASTLPTYYKNTIFWEEADTLFVVSNMSDLDIVSSVKPAPTSGNGIISGYLEEEDGTGGRSKDAQKLRRVGGAAVTARRVESAGRGKDEILTLVAYVFTNENGEFKLPNLPTGIYRLNIQYPGYPMDDNSFTTITIGDALESQVTVSATVEHGKINVKKMIITGTSGNEHYRLDVYPNPALDKVSLMFSRRADRRISIVDMNGSRLCTIHTNEKEVQLSVSDLKVGMYFLRVKEQGVLVKTLKLNIE